MVGVIDVGATLLIVTHSCGLIPISLHDDEVCDCVCVAHIGSIAIFDSSFAIGARTRFVFPFTFGNVKFGWGVNGSDVRFGYLEGRSI